MIRIDARKSDALKSIILALNGADREIQKQIRQQTKALIVPEWQEALASYATTVPENKVLVATAVPTVSNQNIRLAAATKGRPLSGGLDPKTEFGGIAFGTKKRGKKVKYLGRYQRGRTNTTFEVNRRTSEQLKPYKKSGYVFYPAVKSFVPRVASLWAQTTVRVLAEALEGKK